MGWRASGLPDDRLVGHDQGDSGAGRGGMGGWISYSPIEMMTTGFSTTPDLRQE